MGEVINFPVQVHYYGSCLYLNTKAITNSLITNKRGTRDGHENNRTN